MFSRQRNKEKMIINYDFLIEKLIYINDEMKAYHEKMKIKPE